MEVNRENMCVILIGNGMVDDHLPNHVLSALKACKAYQEDKARENNVFENLVADDLTGKRKPSLQSKEGSGSLSSLLNGDSHHPCLAQNQPSPSQTPCEGDSGIQNCSTSNSDAALNAMEPFQHNEDVPDTLRIFSDGPTPPNEELGVNNTGDGTSRMEPTSVEGKENMFTNLAIGVEGTSVFEEPRQREGDAFSRKVARIDSGIHQSNLEAETVVQSQSSLNAAEPLSMSLQHVASPQCRDDKSSSESLRHQSVDLSLSGMGMRLKLMPSTNSTCCMETDVF